MVYRPRPRKRVCAIRRGSDGSAFQKCEKCESSVAIALADMHECQLKEEKKVRTHFGCDVKIERQRIEYQIRSPFRFFVEEFIKTCKDGNEVEIDSKAWDIWKNMSKEERRPFVDQADKLNSAYLKLLQKEEREMVEWIDEEADSAEVGKYDENYTDLEVYHDYGSSDGHESYSSETRETIDTKILLEVCPWATQKTA